jgi:hypothetical protein
MMLQTQLALIAAALFTGASAYINIAEHPARMRLDDQAALEQWKPSYARAVPMQAGLALAGAALAGWAWSIAGDPLLLAAAILLAAIVAFTLIVIFPTNSRLKAARAAGPDSRAHLVRWGRLHAVRTLLAAGATLSLLAASLR